VIRILSLIAVLVGACFLSSRFAEHHSGSNADPFNLLYMHVVPAPLVAAPDHADADGDGAAEHRGSGHDEDGHQHQDAGDGHATVEHPLVAITLPDSMALFDGDRNPDNGTQLVMSNLQIFQIAALLMMVIAFSGVSSYLRTGSGDAVTRVMTGFCMWIRDEMVEPVMGRERAQRFLPYFLSIFFFILFMNLSGLVPTGATATASIFVTAALALLTFLAMVGCGMAAQGPVAFWKNLVPHVPWWLWPLMFFVEVLGLVVKPFALMIRLFANMTGGHLVVLSFMGLIFFFAGMDQSAAGWGIAPVAVGFAVFIMIIEAFVALLQAYIFTQLTVLFVGAAVHPEH
jgi:ATP synthase subunit 6